MGRRGLLFQVFVAHALIAVGSLAAVALYARSAIRPFYREQMRDQLEAEARLVADRLEPMLRDGRPAEEIDAVVKHLGRVSGARLTLILPRGKVVADSEEDPARMDDHATRPEIAAAMRDMQPRMSTRTSDTLRTELMYVAVPLASEGRLLAVVRAAVPATRLDEGLRSLQRSLAATAMFVAVLMLAASGWIARRVSRPLGVLAAGAERFARGDLDHRLEVAGPLEVRVLAEKMETMAAQLRQRFDLISRQRNQQEAMLRGMVEGVLALDPEGRVLELNAAAATMLGIDPETARGRLIHETVRKPDLLDFIENVVQAGGPIAGDITLHVPEDRHFHVHGASLFDAQRDRIGTLVVLHDVTRLRRLETIRRDFVANVSHELRTPITSIKGYAETLLDGALDDRADAERFVATILKQADRLIAIISDIFALSRIEDEAEKKGIERRPSAIREAIESAVRICQPQAEEKSIAFEIDVEEPLVAEINPPLVEQAVVNLLDNAVKYSPAGAKVRIVGRREDRYAVIRVIDQGCGIEAKHLPRLFERFYRVDKSRSRELGGTGLGLAIVKHIVAAHDGTVTVESRPGQGSTFSVYLPIEAAAAPAAPTASPSGRV